MLKQQAVLLWGPAAPVRAAKRLVQPRPCLRHACMVTLPRRPPRRGPCIQAIAAAGDFPGPQDAAAPLRLPGGPPVEPVLPVAGGAQRWSSLRSQYHKAKASLASEYDAELFSLALPALASMLLDPIMNVISASMIGHLGTQQMAAVSLGSLAVSFATFTFGFLVFLTTPKVAAAFVVGDKGRVSRHAAVGLWLALACGLLVTVGLVGLSGYIIAALRPPEPAVAAYAAQFIQIRAWGVLSALIGFVAAGTYRGVKDTVTPLQAAGVATGSNLVLSVALVYGLNLGVAGAALAATLASWVSAAMLVGLLFKKKLLYPADAARRPDWSEVRPYVSQGLVLAFRMVVTFGVIMYASAMCVRLGAASQAAFEVIRQLWILSIQLFECLNVATQSMAASLLGTGDRAAALALLRRATGLSVAVGAAVGLALMLLQRPLVAVFTNDAVVTQMCLAIIPMIALLMPIDAGASIADGGFIAAGQTNMLSAIQVFGSLTQMLALSWAVSSGAGSALVVWGVLKLMSVFRFGGGAYMHFVSSTSAYLPPREEAKFPKEQPAMAEVDSTAAADSAAEADSTAEADTAEADSTGGDLSSMNGRREDQEEWLQRELRAAAQSHAAMTQEQWGLESSPDASHHRQEQRQGDDTAQRVVQQRAAEHAALDLKEATVRQGSEQSPLPAAHAMGGQAQ